jgi:molybdate transport system substrate-binding protein
MFKRGKTVKETVMTRRTIISFLSALLVFVPVFGVSSTEAGEITVSAAISLKNAFEELGGLYRSSHRTKVFLNFGASGDLARQIKGGAPVDVFASAAEKDMDALEKGGLLIKGSRVDFAGNEVVLVAPFEGSFKAGFEGLLSPSVKKIALGNPVTVPAGRYASQVLDHYKLSRLLKDKLVFAENVRQVLDYVARGEVDAGIVYATDASIRAKEVRISAVAPKGSHKPVVYPMALVKDSRNKDAAKAFVELVLSPEGQRILAKYGFRKP